MLPDRRSGNRAVVDVVKARPSIRVRLLMLAVLAIAPLMFDRVRLLEADRAEHVAAAYRQARMLARQALEGQQDVVVAARAVLQVVARAHAAGARSGQSCSELFAHTAIDVPWLKGLSLVDREGRIVCSTFPNAEGLDLSDRPYFREVTRTGDFVVSDYLVSRLQNSPAIVAALPTRGPDRSMTGMITASIDVHWIGRLNDAVKDRQGAMAIVVDGAATVLGVHPPAGVQLGRKLGDKPLVEAMLDRAEGTITTVGVDGVRRMFAFQRLEGTDAHVAVGLDEAEVLSRINRETSIAYTQLAFICAIVLFGVWVGGERLIIQPIRLLARSATRIGLGSHDTRLCARPWAAEFAPLAVALDNMARKLGAREDDLRFANAHLSALASIDGLSGLANRRAFDAALAAQWQQAADEHHALGLLMIDVDHFKLFNDNHGHVEGDECLRAVGEVIAGIAHEGSYLAARYGGEEFTLLLPGVDTERARATAERLRQAVADLHIANAGASSGDLTISVGVASLDPQPEQNPQMLVETADFALYAAKRAGRNAVVAHSTAALSHAC